MEEDEIYQESIMMDSVESSSLEDSKEGDMSDIPSGTL
jgi:hypothetical protein